MKSKDEVSFMELRIKYKGQEMKGAVIKNAR